MPELVMRDLPATQVKPGHVWLGSEIQTVKVGRKWVTVTLDPPFDGKREWPLAIDQQYEIGVMEPTQAEKDAKQKEREDLCRSELYPALMKRLDAWLAAPDAADAYREERTAKGWELLDYSSLTAQLEGYAKGDLARWLKKAILDETRGTEFERALWVMQAVDRQLAALSRQVRVLNRSSSMVSNLCEDLKIWAHAQFLTESKWDCWGVPELEDLLGRY